MRESRRGVDQGQETKRRKDENGCWREIQKGPRLKGEVGTSHRSCLPFPPAFYIVCTMYIVHLTHPSIAHCTLDYSMHRSTDFHSLHLALKICKGSTIHWSPWRSGECSPTAHLVVARLICNSLRGSRGSSIFSPIEYPVPQFFFLLTVCIPFNYYSIGTDDLCR